MKPFRLACIQLGSETADKEANLTLALDMMKEAATNGAHMVLLPEYALLRNFNKTTAEAEAEDFGCTPETDFEVSTSCSHHLRPFGVCLRRQMSTKSGCLLVLILRDVTDLYTIRCPSSIQQVSKACG